MAESPTSAKGVPNFLEKKSHCSSETSKTEHCVLIKSASIVSKATPIPVNPSESAPPRLIHKDSPIWQNASQKLSTVSSKNSLMPTIMASSIQEGVSKVIITSSSFISSEKHPTGKILISTSPPDQQGPNAEAIKNMSLHQPGLMQPSASSASRSMPILSRELKAGMAKDTSLSQLPRKTDATSVSKTYLTISNALAGSTVAAPKSCPTSFVSVPNPSFLSGFFTNSSQDQQPTLSSASKLKGQTAISPVLVGGDGSLLTHLQKKMQNPMSEVKPSPPVVAIPQYSRGRKTMKIALRQAQKKSQSSNPLPHKISDTSTPLIVAVSKPLSSLSSSTSSASKESLIYVSRSCDSGGKEGKTSYSLNPTRILPAIQCTESVSPLIEKFEDTTSSSRPKYTIMQNSWSASNQTGILSSVLQRTEASLPTQQKLGNITGTPRYVVSKGQPASKPVSLKSKSKQTLAAVPVFTLPPITSQGHVLLTFCPTKGQFVPAQNSNCSTQKSLTSGVKDCGILDRSENQRPASMPVSSQPGHKFFTLGPSGGEYAPVDSHSQKLGSPHLGHEILDSNNRPTDKPTVDSGNKASRVYLVNAMTGQGQVPVMVMAPDLDCDSDSESLPSSNLETTAAGHQDLTQAHSQGYSLKPTFEDGGTGSDIEMGDIEEQELSLLSQMLPEREKTDPSTMSTSVSLTQKCRPGYVKYKDQQTQADSPVRQKLTLPSTGDSLSSVNSPQNSNSENFKHSMSTEMGSDRPEMNSDGHIDSSKQLPEEDDCMGLKIESVFSLRTEIETEVDNTVHQDKKVNNVVNEIQEKPETHMFNVQDSEEWKNTVIPCFVVLERQSKSDVQLTLTGQLKTQPRCSNYCRKRTLDYLCNLNLLSCDCDNSLLHTSTTKQDMIQVSQNAPKYDLKKTNSPKEAQAIKDANSNVPALPVPNDCTTNISPSSTVAAEIKTSLIHSSPSPPSVTTEPETQDLLPVEKIPNLGQFHERLMRSVLQKQVERKREQMRNEKFSSKKRKISEVTSGGEKTDSTHKQACEHQKLPISSTFLQRPKEKSKKTAQVSSASGQVAKRKHQQISTLGTKSDQIKRANEILDRNSRVLSALEKPIPTKRYTRKADTPSVSSSLPNSSMNSNLAAVTKPSGSTSLLSGKSFSKEGSLPASKVQDALKSLAKYLTATGRNVTQGNTQYFLLKIDGKHVLVKVPSLPSPSAKFDLTNVASMEELKAAAKAAKKSDIPAGSNIPTPTSSSKVTKTTESATRNSSHLVQSISKTAKNDDKSAKRANTSGKSIDGSNNVNKTPESNVSNVNNTVSTTVAASSPRLLTQLQPAIQPQSQRSVALMKLQERKRAQAAGARQSSQTGGQMPCASSSRADKEKIYGDPGSCLAHIPANSLLLPQRKESTTLLTENERKLKREKLEARYPLPPGVFIKSEPEDTGYEAKMDSHSSYMPILVSNDGVRDSDPNSYGGCTKISKSMETTGEEEEIVTNIEDPFFNQGSTPDDTSDMMMSGYDYTSELIRESLTEGIRSNTFEEPLSESVDTGETDFNFLDEPPPLIDETCAFAETKSVSNDECVDSVEERPPILQPMFTSSSTLSWEGSMKISDESSDDEKTPETNNASSSVTSLHSVGSSHSEDTGCNMSISQSSSSSLSTPTLKKSLGTASSSKSSSIQHLRELLKKKEMEIANIKKMRSELPQIDLDTV